MEEILGKRIMFKVDTVAAERSEDIDETTDAEIIHGRQGHDLAL